MIGDSGASVSNSDEGLPHQCRLIRNDRYHVVWYEKNIGDLVALALLKNEIDSGRQTYTRLVIVALHACFYVAVILAITFDGAGVRNSKSQT